MGIWGWRMCARYAFGSCQAASHRDELGGDLGVEDLCALRDCVIVVAARQRATETSSVGIEAGSTYHFIM